MDIDDIRNGAVVRHFKYETLSEQEKAEKKYLYEIIGTAIHTETEEKMVIYRALYGEKTLWVRPLELFLSPVDKKKFPFINQCGRFELFLDKPH